MTPCRVALHLFIVFLQCYSHFTDWLAVFIFILASVYRTLRRFPHRLTIPAFKLFVVSHYVYNLFSVEIYKLHGVSQFFIVPLISWETFLICYFYLKLVKPFTVRCKRWGVFIEIGWLALLSFYPSHIPRGKPHLIITFFYALLTERNIAIPDGYF